MRRRLVTAAMPINNSNKIVTVLYEDGKPAEIHVDAYEDRPVLNNIYVGHVNKVSPDSGGSFLTFSENLQGFLPRKKSRNPIYANKKINSDLKAEDEIIVMVDREASGSKPAGLTCDLKITGNSLVLNCGTHGFLYSSKLDSCCVKSLSEYLSGFSFKYGFIVRTAASYTAKEDIISEACELSEKMDEIIERGRHSLKGTCLYRTHRFWIQKLKAMNFFNNDEAVTDIPKVYGEMKDFYLRSASCTGDFSDQIRFYEDSDVSLYKLYNFTTILDNALSQHVSLPSGGYLVIQKTEAFTCIDVNSGKSAQKKETEYTTFKINAEAAAEAARQIRLRQISGAVLIDFINMKSKKHQRKLAEIVSEVFKRDSTKAEVVDYTALGIMEVTRTKSVRPLYEQVRGTIQ